MSEVAAITGDLERGLGSVLETLRGIRDGNVSSDGIWDVCVEVGILAGEVQRLKRLLSHAGGPVRAFRGRDGKMRAANDHSFESEVGA
jgi:hypothetical protein